MKIKNVIQIIIIAVLALGIGLFLRQQNIPNQTSEKSGHHDIWYCPMHPHYTSDHPGQCPICGMSLVKKIEASLQHGSGIEGYTTVVESAQKQQLAGVQTAVVGQKSVIKTIRAAGQYEEQVYAQVFENDLEFIKVGQKAMVEIPAYHQKYEGNVRSIDSTVEEVSRTVRVRIWINQSNQKKLKSNMFVNVEFPVKLGEAIIVPREAVMDTGVRKIIFVCKAGNSFEPREIQTGWETDDGYEVKSGLKSGEHIVVSGNFLLDSESRVQAGLEQGEDHG